MHFRDKVRSGTYRSLLCSLFNLQSIMYELIFMQPAVGLLISVQKRLLEILYLVGRAYYITSDYYLRVLCML